MTHPPKKILILGNGGSGKTTLSLALKKTFPYPLLHLDAIYWQDGSWQHKPCALFQRSVNAILETDCWIIEGTPMQGIEERIGTADTIIFLDSSAVTSVCRILIRALKGLLTRKRCETDKDCPAMHLNIKGLLWVYRFNKMQRNRLLTLIDQARPTHCFIINNRDSLKRLPTTLLSIK